VNPQYHLDQDISRAVAELLNAHYRDTDCAKRATELGLFRAYDGHHLLVAAQTGRILVTHNANDFITMHDAWLRWSTAWRVTPRPQHAGILVVPQSLRPPAAIVAAVVAFVGTRIALPNEIHAYDEDVRQWVQNPLPRR